MAGEKALPPRSWERGEPLDAATGWIPGQIHRQARLRPDALAVVQHDRALSYRELAGRSLRLAESLQAKGIGPEDVVGLCLRRGLELPVAVLGVLFAGGAYLPVHPDDPARRRADVLADAGCRIVIVDAAGRNALTGSALELLDVPAESASGNPAEPRRDQLAYVLYTSGSTGAPKGVLVDHGALADFVRSTRELSGITADTVALAFASLGFDVSVMELFSTLSGGGTVALVPEEDRIDPVRLRDFCVAHRVSWAYLPPPLLPLLDPARMPDLADAFTGGEAPSPAQVTRWVAAGKRVVNTCGPTETVVSAVGSELTGSWDAPVPLGKPFAGRRVYIVDEQLRPVPVGEAGELCVGGARLARGYLNRPGGTAERFVPDPFTDEPGARMYRTGDLFRWDGTGTLHYLGRLDRQVKIQGQRAEIGEVEAVLASCPGVSQAVVQAVTELSGTTLVAYLTPETAPGPAEIRAHCATRLPSYMIPGAVHRVAAFPLTSSAKIDMTALRALTTLHNRRTGAVTGSVPPGYAEVAAAWAAVFGVAPGPEDDFFARGGHSLAAMRLVAELWGAISVEDVWQGRTAAGIARRLGSAGRAVPTGSAPRLTAAQRQLWFVDRLAPDAGAYNIAMAFEIAGPLDVPALGKALAAVAGRHEALRYRITLDAVTVTPPEPFELVVDRIEDRALPSRLDNEAAAPFDIARQAPWRARLFRLGAQRHVLAVTVHHAVFDGWSQSIYLRDLAVAYGGAAASTPPLGVSRQTPFLAQGEVRFADYASWRESRPDQLDWMTRHLEGAPFVLDLPHDHARPPVQTFRGARHRLPLPPAVASAVRSVASAAGTTPAVVLLAAFGELLRRLTGRRDLVVGMPVADRGHAAFTEVVGLLLDTLPVRLRPDPGASFASAVAAAGQELLDVLAHREVSLERLVDRLGIPRDPSRNPLFQVLFNVLPETAPLELSGAEVRPVEPGLAGSPFDLTCYVHERTDGIDLELLYNPELFREERISALAAGFAALTANLVKAPELPVRRASMRHGVTALPALPELPTGPDVVTRVLDACAADPEGVAVAGERVRITRADLAGHAGAVAFAAQRAGVRPGAVVAVLAGRDPWLPGLLLGVLAFGGRYAVLDANAPAAGLARQVAAVGADALLVGASVEAPAELADVVRLKPGDPRWPDPAFGGGMVTLTSGSTGKPRAVVADQRTLAHFLDWYPRTWRLTKADRFAMTAGLGHDPLARDVFLPLTLGATLHVPPEPRNLADWLAEHRITVLHATPQLLRLLGGRVLRDLRLVAVGGDRLSPADVRGLRSLAPAARLVNVYGTTETPQIHSFHEIRGERAAVPVGSGAPGSALVVLDAEGRPAAVGELGEIAVRSRFLAEGYRDEDSDRFRREDAMFLTGDLGRHDPDGEVVVAGRADRQLKIRGHRVEPAEVETALTEHEGVRAAVVVGIDDDTLAAYAVADGASAEELRRHLRERLPEYAVPATVTLLPELPMTTHHKVDIEALPAPAPKARTAGPPPTMTPTERLVADVWRAVLGLPSVGLDDSFFDIGGHSMAIVRVAERLSAALGRPVEIVDLFRHVNVRSLAAALDRGEHNPALDRAARRVAARRRHRPVSKMEEPRA